jgi:prepilin-type N-terminal cleavage/methylation domain-containing protein
LKEDNKGFSLIELIVSIAILAIVAAASMGFMLSGTQGYSSVSSNVNLQNKSQLAMNYIQEYLIDCNEGVFFSDADDTLYIIDSENVVNAETGAIEKAYTAHIFKYDSGSESLYYGENSATLVSTDVLTCADSAPDLLTDGVSSFSVDLADGTRVADATVTISFFVRNKTFTGVQTIALRNRPMPVTVAP